MLRFRTSEAVRGRNQRCCTNTAGGVQPPTGAGQHCDPCHNVTLMASTGEDGEQALMEPPQGNWKQGTSAKTFNTCLTC